MIENIDKVALAKSVELAQSIETQNTTYDALFEGDNPVDVEDLGIIALGHLAEQQEADWEEITGDDIQSAHTALSDAYVEASSTIRDLEAEIEDIDTQASEVVDTIERDAGRILELIPELKDEIDSKADALVNKSREAASGVLRARLASAQLDVEAIHQIIEEYGQAWPIPQLIARTAHLAYVDKFPDEKESPGGSEAGVARKSPEHYEREASEILAMTMSSVPGSAMTLSEIGISIYGNSLNDNVRTARVSALISNHRLGKVTIIGEALAPAGLVLQRGTRHFIRDGKKDGSPVAVFRAIDPNSTPSAELEFTATSIDGKRIDHVDIDWEQIGAMVQSVERVKRTREPGWAKEFRGAVLNELKKLEDNGLLNDETVTWNRYRKAHSARTAGTEEQRRRGVENKIVTNAEVASADNLISVPQLVALGIQNKFEQRFKTKRSRDVALRIVREEVRGYLADMGE